MKLMKFQKSIVSSSKRGMITIRDNQMERFRLDPKFAKGYSPASLGRPVQFGFNGVGELAYKRSYARVRDDLGGRQEQWHETVERVVNGVFTMYFRHSNTLALPWDADQKTLLAQKMYDKIYNFKFLPPGRGLWAMGTPITEDKHLYAALNNCAFVSTLPKDPKSQDHAIAKFIDSFVFLMDSSMIGVGVGFDTKGSHLNLHLHRPQPASSPYEIPDTREGWVDSLRILLSSYLYPGRPKALFDYSKIRPPGVPLKTFGGQSSGPGPLIDMHKLLEKRFDDKLEKDGDMSKVTSRDIVDIMNIIGRCVIAGNIRRVAEIALGEAHDSDFIQLKDY
jgi:ribonucleotide reductase alpha subunit